VSEEVTGHLSDAPIDYFDDIQPEVAAPATLERLVSMAKEARALEAEINADNVVLEEKKAKLDRIHGLLIPNIMEELGMSNFTLQDGSVIDVKNDLRASIKVENRNQAWQWLESQKHDGIIKTKVVSEFGRGELAKANELLEKLSKEGQSAALDRSVHPATLKSFVKERLEADANLPADANPALRLPRDIFGVYEFKRSEIKLPKVKKGKK